jgi:hypothetical protein
MSGFRLSLSTANPAPVATRLLAGPSPSPNALPRLAPVPQAVLIRFEHPTRSPRTAGVQRPRRLTLSRWSGAVARAPSAGRPLPLRARARGASALSRKRVRPPGRLPRLQFAPDVSAALGWPTCDCLRRTVAGKIARQRCVLLNAPLEPTGRFRTTHGAATVAAITAGSSLGFAAPWWKRLLSAPQACNAAFIDSAAIARS